jgi:hypothetical protein
VEYLRVTATARLFSTTSAHPAPGDDGGQDGQLALFRRGADDFGSVAMEENGVGGGTIYDSTREDPPMRRACGFEPIRRGMRYDVLEPAGAPA